MIARQDLQHAARGFLMGGADIIPGVSGGTVALILGIYKRLVTAISRFDVQLLIHLRKRRWGAAASHVDLRFLVSLGCGIAGGILSLASLMHYLLEHQRQFTFAAFFGLILASSLLVAQMVERWNAVSYSCLLAAAVGAYWLVGLPVLDRPPDGNGYVFFCGVIGICAMILPGISGAFILLVLGKYSDIAGLPGQFVRHALNGEFAIAATKLVTISVFCTGCLIGLLSFSKLLKWLLGRYESQTMALLCGFMVGSLRKIWPFKYDLTPHHEFKQKDLVNVWPQSIDGDVLLTIVIAVIAALFVLTLDRLTKGHEHIPPLAEGQNSAE